MTRAEALKLYDVSPRSGVIITPGKFEGEEIWVPVIGTQCMEGGASEDHGTFFSVVFDNDDRNAFSEIGEAYGCLLSESDTGFVTASEFDTKEEFDAAVERWERAEAQSYDEEEVCNAGFDASEEQENG
jgi:hypothetical protein